VECSFSTTKVVIEYYFLMFAQSFLVLAQKTGQKLLRTVRKFWSGIFRGEIREANDVFGVEILRFTLCLPCKYLSDAIAVPYFWQKRRIL
jgi:hypothetical protein